MKILALGDTHLGLFKGRTKEARHAYARYCHRQFQFVIDEAIRQQVDLVIHTGDVFNRSAPPAWILGQYYQTIERALSAGIAVAVIPGNHDKSEINPSLLDYFYPDYHLFNSIQSVEFDEFQLIGLPYQSHDLELVMDKIYEMSGNLSKPTIIITHQLFRGATFGPHQFSFSSQDNVIDTTVPDNVLIISGHIHRAQVLATGQVIYTGSTVRASFVEIIEPKGYLMIEFDRHSININFVEIPTKPMKIIEIDGRLPDPDQIDLMLANTDPDAEILLRLIHSYDTTTLKQQLLATYPADSWPYLSIHDGGPDTRLRPVYSTYSDQFHFPTYHLSWQPLITSFQNTAHNVQHNQD